MEKIALSLNIVVLSANLVWMIYADIAFRKRHKKLQKQLDKLIKD